MKEQKYLIFNNSNFTYSHHFDTNKNDYKEIVTIFNKAVLNKGL